MLQKSLFIQEKSRTDPSFSQVLAVFKKVRCLQRLSFAHCQGLLSRIVNSPNVSATPSAMCTAVLQQTAVEDTMALLTQI